MGAFLTCLDCGLISELKPRLTLRVFGAISALQLADARNLLRLEHFVHDLPLRFQCSIDFSELCLLLFIVLLFFGAHIIQGCRLSAADLRQLEVPTLMGARAEHQIAATLSNDVLFTLDHAGTDRLIGLIAC